MSQSDSEGMSSPKIRTELNSRVYYPYKDYLFLMIIDILSMLNICQFWKFKFWGCHPQILWSWVAKYTCECPPSSNRAYVVLLCHIILTSESETENKNTNTVNKCIINATNVQTFKVLKHKKCIMTSKIRTTNNKGRCCCWKIT